MPPVKFGAGQLRRRVEDAALVTGRGCYVADAIPEGALRAVVLRSPHAHAKFAIGDLAAVRNMPGVRLVLTGADVAKCGSLPCNGLIKPKNESKVWVPPFAILAQGVARFVGDAVAFVVADTADAARDAAEAIAIDWEPLAAAVGMREAVGAGAPLVWPERAANVAFLAEHGDAAATARAFAQAAQTVKLDLVNPRVVANFMETRGAIGAPGPDEGRFTLTVSSQGSHTVRDAISGVLRMPKDRLRVVTNDVGGGFGTKAGPYREYALVVIAARQLGVPVAWVADRSEHFLGDSMGRDNLTSAEIALDSDGRFLALRVDTLANMGGYLSYYAPYIPYNGALMLPGCYHIPAAHVRVRGVYTHTAPIDAYRGAGRPEAAYVIERLVDAIARARNESPDQVRLRNFIKPAEMPYKTDRKSVV